MYFLDTRQLLYNSRNCIKMSYNSMSSCKTLSSTSLFRKVSVQNFMWRKKRTFVHNYDVALLFNPVSNCIYFFRWTGGSPPAAIAHSVVFGGGCAGEAEEQEESGNNRFTLIPLVKQYCTLNVHHGFFTFGNAVRSMTADFFLSFVSLPLKKIDMCGICWHLIDK